ncbi:MAG: restriction endonuclease subunit S [Microgenomates group bacterium]
MKSTFYNDIVNSKYNLDPHQLSILALPNKKTLSLDSLLDRRLKKSDNGVEIGSNKYLFTSSHYFIRAKSLQSHSFLPTLSTESYVPINPNAFVNYHLQKGDILISKDSNIGEVIILDKDYSNFMLSGALYKLPITNNKYYILGFLKSDMFKNQLDLKVSKGVTIRHAGKKFLECGIPFPNQKDEDQIVNYIGSLVEVLVNKEIEIKNKYEQVLHIIDSELKSNQKLSKNYAYSQPKLSDIKSSGRINAAFYSNEFKQREYLIKNYKYGYRNVYELGFDVSRGQNLQVSAIGKSVYLKTKRPNFYTLLLPRNFSIYGTILKEEYLGNSRKLKTLKEGDIIFGAEGFEKGRSAVILSDQNRTITNIHGITLNHKSGDSTLSMFVKCFLDYLRKNGLIDYYAVGGNGGSLAMKYWEHMPFPNFPLPIQEEIAKLFYSNNSYRTDLTIDNFVSADSTWNKLAGIYDIDRSMKLLKNKLDNEIEKITNNERVEINFQI